MEKFRKIVQESCKNGKKNCKNLINKRMMSFQKVLP